MTFYWWSHWFWITLLSNILIPIDVVQTYPSQEISLEYNQNSRPQKIVTKLFQQTTTTLTWASTTAPYTLTMSTVGEKTILQNVTPSQVSGRLEESAEIVTTTVEEVDAGTVELSDDSDEANISAEELEFKRSAENYNQTVELVPNVQSAQSPASSVAHMVAKKTSAPAVEKQTTTAESAAKLKRGNVELSNYTNFSRTQDVSANNSVAENASSTPTAKADSGHGSLERLDTAVPATEPPIAMQQAEESVTVPQRIPFTLENANKEEELRRAESEHRSRKSKVLSAEYKHINRFINYSADTKSLLTRSASTAPNDFDEGDESNISSEALSIQRTYFLDAGAISAICFTIFGVCCTVGTIGIVLYRRRYLNKPQALSEPDSSVYIDDSTMRDNSDEMYSLDNDSFLNSLEAMTIQNYWTDTVKHTKL